MKLQDIGFGVLSMIFLFSKHPRLFLVAGLTSWFLAIPLFARWVFFTAERLTWYGAAWILLYVLSVLIEHDEVE